MSKITNSCVKANAKIQLLARVTLLMNVSKKRFFMNHLLKLQFSYCPLAGTFRSHRDKKLIGFMNVFFKLIILTNEVWNS